jgi:hypothetical protein
MRAAEIPGRFTRSETTTGPHKAFRVCGNHEMTRRRRSGVLGGHRGARRERNEGEQRRCQSRDDALPSPH